MKTVEGFKLRRIVGEAVIVAEELGAEGSNKLISLNASAAKMWESVEGKEFTVEDLVQVLLSDYDIDCPTARADVMEIVAKWKEIGLIEGE